MNNDKEVLEAAEYFSDLKSKQNKIELKELDNIYDGYLALVEKYKTTGQKKLIRKLKFLAENIEKEKKVVNLGIDSFVYRDDIEDYIDKVAKNVVKIIELENYPRDIPDNIVDKISKTKDIFDKMYVVFTDYTGKVEKAVKKERREKDPILFGTFQEKSNGNRSANIVNDRFYYIGDWVDEYCDLTMDKFLKEAGQEKLQNITTPLNKEELEKELDRLDDNYRRLNDKEIKPQKKPKNTIFKEIVNYFQKWTNKK